MLTNAVRSAKVDWRVRISRQSKAMPEAGYLLEFLVILLAAVVSVLVFQRLRLGAGLGYLLAGPVPGPAGLPLIPYPTEKGTYQAVLLPEIKLEKTGDKEKDIFRWTQEYQKLLEKVIREHPEPWMWIHRRWKTRPPEEKNALIY